MGFVDEVTSIDHLLPTAIELAKKLGAYKTSTYAAIKLGNREHVIETMKSRDMEAALAAVKAMMAG